MPCGEIIEELWKYKQIFPLSVTYVTVKPIEHTRIYESFTALTDAECECKRLPTMPTQDTVTKHVINKERSNQNINKTDNITINKREQ